MRRYRITLDGRTFDVALLSDPQQAQVEVEVDGESFLVQVEAVQAVGAVRELPAATPPADVGAVREPPKPPQTAPGAPPSPPGHGPAGNVLAAPLPGVIKSVAVRPGQQVSVGETLLVIEAMKMDNVIRARRGGVVEVIHVAEGQRVAFGDALLDFAP
jgi:biotin carboxyl carrier protein